MKIILICKNQTRIYKKIPDIVNYLASRPSNEGNDQYIEQPEFQNCHFVQIGGSVLGVP
jgi:hypothetical protein